MQTSEYRCPSCGAELEHVVGKESIRYLVGKKENSSRVFVRITSFRQRLIDPDNLVGKYFLDACRYAGLLRDDKESEITYEITQVPVVSKSEQRTEIEIIYPEGYKPLVNQTVLFL